MAVTASPRLIDQRGRRLGTSPQVFVWVRQDAAGGKAFRTYVQEFWFGVAVTVIPSALVVAWLVWRAQR